MPPIEPPTTEQFPDPQMIQQRFLRPHHIPDGDHRELQAVGLARCGFMRRRAGGAHAASRMLEQMTKYLSVSMPLPGPTMISHQPGLASSGSSAVLARPHGSRRKRHGRSERHCLCARSAAVGLIGDGHAAPGGRRFPGPSRRAARQR